MGEPVLGMRDRPAVLLDQPGCDRARAGHADLLAEHGAYGDLVAVDMTRHAQPRQRADQRPDHRVTGERVADRDRVAVGVEQPAHPLGRGAGVAQVLQRERRGHERGLARLGGVGDLQPHRS